mmetsp:Transcript_27278/g.58773  ORF Transcript_27278/g.58773 Transcript_27278/m.58773 type:complete len:212 (+) Transcript_27278:453-1088(+)
MPASIASFFLRLSFLSFFSLLVMLLALSLSAWLLLLFMVPASTLSSMKDQPSRFCPAASRGRMKTESRMPSSSSSCRSSPSSSSSSSPPPPPAAAGDGDSQVPAAPSSPLSAAPAAPSPPSLADFWALLAFRAELKETSSGMKGPSVRRSYMASHCTPAKKGELMMSRGGFSQAPRRAEGSRRIMPDSSMRAATLKRSSGTNSKSAYRIFW